MAITLDQNEIKASTKIFWEHHRSDFDYYIDNLLGHELTNARDHPLDNGTSRLATTSAPVHTLILTVGESFEPLLQIVCVLRPKRVVLILNDFYGCLPGCEHGATLMRLMVKLAMAPNLPEDMRPSLGNRDIDPICLDADTPTHVFRALRDAMQKTEAIGPPGHVNVVDITGAKKSMVVGAFLYAAHSNMPITYVDFDDYDNYFGKPYGFTCRIGQIANPYEAFRLRDWERVRQLYNKYDFRGAHDLVEQINEVMSVPLSTTGEGDALYTYSDIEHLEGLVETLQMYEAWDSGNFNQAVNYASPVPVGDLPSALTELGEDWSEISPSNVAVGPSDFYADLSRVKVYAYDELHRIARLISHYQDYRSAILRSGGLNEVVLTARLVDQIDDEPVRRKLLDALQKKVPNGRSLFLQLQRESGEEIRLDKLGLEGVWTEKPRIKVQMTDWWSKSPSFKGKTGWESFIELRNTLAHRYVSVVKVLADDSLAFVTENFNDFFDSRRCKDNLVATAVPWHRLCVLCQLDFLPPELRN